MSTASSKRFGEVDSLRAIACALVIIWHSLGHAIQIQGHPSLLYSILIDTFELGIIGVIMFFAISGFVIPDSLRGTRWQGVKAFSIRRFWRLYPPFWLALLLTFWRDKGMLVGPWDAVMLPSLGIRGRAFFHFWTLEVELVFYLLIAVLFLVFGRLGWKVLVPGYLLLIALAVRNAIASDSVLDYDTMLPCIVVMFWGGLCREIFRFDFSRWQWVTPKRGVDWARSVALGFASGMTLIVLLINYSAVREMTGRSYELAGFLSVLGFLFWVVLTPVKIRWLSHIGRWTYSTYLLHILTIKYTAKLISNFPGFAELPYASLLFIGLCLLGSFAVGALAYRWIEQPSDRIGKRLTLKKARAS